MDKAIEAVIEAVKSASPTLWAAAQQKVQADIANAHFWMWAAAVIAGLSLLATVLLIWVAFSDKGDEGLLGGAVVFLVLMLGAGVVSAIHYTNVMVREKAPQWYAIKALAELSPLK
jgi:hypothetical protein